MRKCGKFRLSFRGLTGEYRGKIKTVKWMSRSGRGMAGFYLASIAIIFSLVLFVACPSVSVAGEKWPGVDEAVVEKIAKEHGREAREPFINTDQGDLLLFVFLAAGAVAGFAAGYYWRILMVERAPKPDKAEE